jgi:hypothetical protein
MFSNTIFLNKTIILPSILLLASAALTVHKNFSENPEFFYNYVLTIKVDEASKKQVESIILAL